MNVWIVFTFGLLKNGAIDTHIEQWNQTESSEIHPYIYSRMIFDKDAMTIHWRMASLFDIQCLEN